MNTFYKIDSTRVSHLEFWWWHKSPLVIISRLMKWLRIPTPCSSDDPNTESTLPFVVESLPPEIATRFEPLANDLAALGFHDPVYHAIEDAGTRATIYWATFRHESGQHFARIHNRVWHQAQNPNRALFPMFFTAFTDGTFLVIGGQAGHGRAEDGANEPYVSRADRPALGKTRATAGKNLRAQADRRSARGKI